MPTPLEAVDELAAGAMRGEETDAKRLFECALPVLSRRVTRHCLNLGIRDRDTQADVVQEVCQDTWSQRKSYRGTRTEEFNAWFSAISHGHCCKAIRRILRRKFEVEMGNGPRWDRDDRSKRGFDGLEPIVQGGIQPSWAIELQEQKEVIHGCLDQLRAKDQSAYDTLSLYFFHNMPSSEIAEVLDWPIGTVKDRFSRGIRKIGQCVKRKLK